MPITTDLNVSPYFDDYDPDNEYYRILFRPSVGVQARELNQVQSIFQNQIENFGNWAFRNGDIVSGCVITDDPVLPFVRLQNLQTNNSNYSIDGLANLQVVSTSSNLTATVITTNQGLTTNYPNTNAVYVNYINTGNNGEKTFGSNATSNAVVETLKFYKIPRTGNETADLVATVNTFANSAASQDASGIAHGIHVDSGIVYINGTFVKVLTPTYGLVNNFGSYAGNNVVGFKLQESIITENQDSSVLDNALGYPNENAPGANRLKLKPTLIALDPDTAANTVGFNPIATYNFGSLVQKAATSNVYSVVGDVIAKRTYEESGNYVVTPFVVDTVTTVPGDAIVQDLSPNNVIGRISPGIGYAQGYRVELLKTNYFEMRRGVDLASKNEQQISFNYGGYFATNETAGSFPFDQAQTVYLFDAPQTAVTRRLFGSLTPAAANGATGIQNSIGTARLRCFSYGSGTQGSNTAIYNIHVFNVKMNDGYTTNQVKSLYYNGSVKGVADVIGTGIQQASTKDQIYSFGTTGLKNLRDADNALNTEYIYRTKKTGATMNTSGDVTVTITTANDILPYGTGQLSDLEAANFNLIATANVDSSDLSGTVEVFSSNTAVKGSSTNFINNFNVYDQIKVNGNVRTITSISNSSFLNVDAAFPAGFSGSYKKSYISGKIIPIARSYGGLNSYINVTADNSFSIITDEMPSSTLNVDVVFDVMRTSAVAAKKDIQKYRFVKLNTTSNPYGPWCLGVSDIHKIRAVYGSPTNSFTDTSGITATDITKNFTYDTGQKDTHYDYGYLYPVPGYTTASYPYLLVELDYFIANNSSGVGFFTVESYSIDDVNTANATAITTVDLPLYVNESGKKIPLRDYVDFRLTSNNQANNTGSCTRSSASSVNTAVSYATTNPNSNTLITIPASGIPTPSYGKNFQSDYTYYLPRKDLILITQDNKIKVKEGISSDSPQTPLYPENAMPLAILNIPPYPSLSTDQLDSLLPINKLSKNLIRDTSSSISSVSVTNRRYTMKDVGTLDSRITNLEYYTALSLLEKKASDMTVTDANGLDRFKNGIFVDPMDDFTQSDVSNPEYSIAIDSKKGVARPRIIREIINVDLDLARSTNIQVTGRLVSLPYTETAFMVQPYSTKYRSSAHVSLAWNGTVKLFPPFDNHSDVNRTGSINITVDLATPWKDFAKSPMGSIWGDWETTTTVESTTVRTGGGFIPVVDLGTVGGGKGWSQAVAEQVALQKIQEMYGTNVTIGRYNLTYSDIRLKKNISRIGKLLNGLNLYRYRYLWSDVFYVGVMAQEVEKLIPEAVVYGSDGYMKVNYGKIGIPFLTWDQWLNTNNSAV